MKYGSYVTPYYGNGPNGSYAHFKKGGFAPATAGQAGYGGTSYLASATSTKLVMVGGAGGYGGYGASNGSITDAEAAAGGAGGNVTANVSNVGFPTGGAAFYEAAIAIGGAGGAGGAGGTPAPIYGPPDLRFAGAGGAGGTAAAASTAVSGASVVGSTASATGGVGGASYYAGAGGGASSAAVSTSTTTSGGGVTASATSTGGAGGYSRYGYGGAGGAATGASATATQTYANTAGTASAVASQTGGVGGASYGTYGYRAGAGGTASNTSASATGYNASATVIQTGGAGGYGKYGGGAGANSTLTDAVSGTTTGGTLTLSQTAAGGGGGSSHSGQGGQGGYATSDLTFSDTTSTVFNSYARAYGGAGGASKYGNGGAGGAAEASDTVTGANTVTAYAGAYGGNGGASVYGSAGYGGAASATSTAVATGAGANSTATANATASSGAGYYQGAANATAAATTAAGQLASAYGAATGSSGLAQSTATTAVSSGPVVSLSSEAQAPVAGSGALANSQADAGTPFGFPHAPPAIGAHPGDAYAFGAIAPNNVATEFSTDPTVAAAFGGEAQAVFGEGVEGANYGSVASGDVTYVSTQNFTLSGADTSGNLIVGLLDSRARGTGFTNLDFQVTVGGVTEEDVSFTSLAAAEAFFSDNVLNLGAMPTTPGTVVSVKLSVTEDAAGQGFGQDFFIGDSNAATINGPPTINVPAAEAIGVGTETIGGISVAETGATTVETFSATISDAIGALSATGFTGDVSNSISISGVSLATLNADLATLADSRGTLASDTITVDVTDSLGNAATQQTIGVTSVFVASPIGGQTFAGRGAGITLELSSASTLLTIDADAGTVTGLRPSATSGGTDTFSDVQTFEGNPGTGGTTFIAGPGSNTYEGAGSGSNTLSYSASTGSVTVNESSGSGTASIAGGGTDTFSDIQTFVGSNAGGNIFTVGAGNATFEGGGGGNELTFAADAPGITIDLGEGTITTANGTDDFTGIQTFVGSDGGGNTFIGAAGSHTLEAGGSGNTLDYSGAPADVTIVVGDGSQLPDEAQNGFGGTDLFSGIQTFIGSDGGGATFLSGGANGLTFTGKGANNTLDLSPASPGLEIQVAAGIVEDGPNTEDFSGIQIFVGAAGGDTDFIAGAAGGLTLIGEGAGNTLDLSAALAGVSISEGFGAGSASIAGGGTDTFSDIQNFVGDGGGGATLISNGATSLTFTGQGAGNTLDLSGALAGISVSESSGAGTASVTGGGTDTFSDVQTFKGSSAGGNVFTAGAGSVTFVGGGVGNELSLAAAAPGGVTFNLAAGTVATVNGTDDFSDIQTFIGSLNGGNTFIASSAGGLTFTGEGPGNTLELGGSTGLLTIDANNLVVEGLKPGPGSSTTDAFSDIQTFVGNTGAGGTTFLAGPGADTYEGEGSGTNTLSFAASSAGSLRIDTVDGTAQADSVGSSFSGIQAFFGLAGGATDFIAGSAGGFAFTGQGAGNTLDLSAALAGVSISESFGAGSASIAGGGTDTFSGIHNFVGDEGGGATLTSNGATSLTFTGEGAGNTLDLSQALAGVSVNESSGAGTASVTGGGTDTFSDVQTFKGSSAGGNVFTAGAGGVTFVGGGVGNELSLAAAAPGGVTFDLAAGTVATANGTDAFSDIQTFIGSLNGGNTFIAGPAGGLTFTGEGPGNTLELGGSTGLLTIDANNLVVEGLKPGPGSSTTDAFSDIQTFVGNTGAGGTTFLAGPGADTYEGEGSGTNTLSFAASSAGSLRIDTVDGTAQADSVGSSFSGIQAFFGLAGGATTFISNGAGGLAFTGEGAGNTLDLSAVTGLLTLNLAAGTATTSSGVEHFSGIQTLTVSAAGGVDLAGIGQATSFSYNAGSQTLTILGGNQTVQLGVAPPPAGDDFSLASDGSGTLLTLTSVAAPSISAPASATITPGHATTIAGVSVAGGDSQDAAETFRATISDTNGDLTATGFSGSATGISINGVSLATLNADLATLSDTDGTAGPDTINYSVTDSFGHTVTRSTAISLGALAGFYLPPGATTPIEDLAGTYSGPGATAPTTDPAGTFSGPGAPAPTTDPAGTFSGLGAAAPTPAAAGTYIPTTGATSAAAEIKDPAGTYSAAGAAAPTQDPAGTFSGVGAATPTTDPAGTYSGKGASAPTTDPAGTFSGPDASAPTPDPSGTYSDPGASAPTAIDAWKNASGGAWTTSGNWKNSVPNATEYAGVQATGTYAVTIGSASAAYGLIINDAGASVNDGPGESLTLDGSNGASNPNGVLYVTAGKFNLEGGALKAASISIGTGGAFLVSGSIFATLAEAITDLGILSIANSAAVTLTGSLSGSGAVLVQNSALVTFDGPITGSEAFTIANSALVTFAGAITGSETFTISNSADVRIASSITGTGSFNLANSAQLEFEAADSEAVNFLAGSTGTLKIDKSLTAPMTGAISGLTTSNRVDLADLGYVSGKMKATYAGTAAGGTLTISNGTKSVALTLAGNYLHSTWTLSKDASGGTLVVDPPASSPALFGQLAASMPTPSCEAYALPAHDLAIGGAGPVLAHPVA